MTSRRTTSHNLFVASALIGSMALHSAASAQSGPGSETMATPSVPSAPVGAEAGPTAAAATNETTSTSSGVADVTGNDIIVTATRRSERLENVPASVLAVTGAALATAGVTRFQDIAVIAPGVQISRSGTYTQPAIRGVSTTFAGGGQETNVAVYVDGFYTSDQLSINQDFANIQDVQVLKGPQGTLYGRNATGGAILLTTRGPTDRLTADGSAAYAPRFNDRRFNAFVGGPIAEGIKFSIAGYYRKSDGYFKDINGFSDGVALDNTTYTFGGRAPALNLAANEKRGGNEPGFFENYSIRPKLVFEPTPDIKVTLGYVHSYVDDPRAFAYGIIGQLGNPGPAYTATGAAVPVGTAGSFPVAINQRDRTSLNFLPRNASKADEFNGTGEFKLGEIGTLTSRTAYRKQSDYQVYDLDATPRSTASSFIINPITGLPTQTSFLTYESVQRNKRKTFTQQLDYSGTFGAFSLLAGLFYYQDTFYNPGTSYEDTGALNGPTATLLNFKTKAYAAYIDGTYNINDKLFITVGGRYSRDEKRLSRTRYSNVGALIPAESTVCYTGGRGSVFTAACNQDIAERTKKNAFTPRAVVRYNISQGTNVYASFSRGFKAGTINTAAPFNELRPETVSAYEIGAKTAQGGFRAEAAAFYYTYKNNQVSSFDGLRTLIRNSGGARIYGYDGTISYRFPDTALNLRASIAYLHARYTKFPDAADVTVGPNDRNVTAIGSWSGRRLIRAPDWTGSVGGDYTLDFAGGKLVTSGTVTLSSRYAPQNASYQCAIGRVISAAGLPVPFGTVGSTNFCAAGTNTKGRGRFEENGYILANAQIAWTDPSEHYTITISGDNITNTRYKIISTGFAYFSYNQYNEPRTVGVKVGFKF